MLKIATISEDLTDMESFMLQNVKTKKDLERQIKECCLSDSVHCNLFGFAKISDSSIIEDAILNTNYVHVIWSLVAKNNNLTDDQVIFIFGRLLKEEKTPQVLKLLEELKERVCTITAKTYFGNEQNNN